MKSITLYIDDKEHRGFYDEAAGIIKIYSICCGYCINFTKGGIPCLKFQTADSNNPAPECEEFEVYNSFG